MSRFFDALQRSQAERSGVDGSAPPGATESKESAEQEAGLEWEAALKVLGKNIAQVYSANDELPRAVELKESVEQQATLEQETTLQGLGKNTGQVDSGKNGLPPITELMASIKQEATEEQEAAPRTFGKSFAQGDSGNSEPSRAAILASDDTRTTPAITWPTPALITYGNRLTFAQLNATAPVEGTFVYAPDAGDVLPAGIHTLCVAFTPADSASHAPAQASVSIIVARATPALSWATPAGIIYGTALSDAQLNASASVPGKFDYSPARGEELPPGTHTLSVTFTPADGANCAAAQASVSLTVARATPVLQWPTPDPITYGTQLSAKQLCAEASVPGTFEYVPGLGAVLPAGEHRLSLVFTPADTLGYSPSQNATSLTVARATTVVAWPTPNPIRYGTELSTRQLCAVAPVPGTFEYDPGLGAVLAAGEHKLSVVFTPADALAYSPSQTATSLTVARATSVIQWPTPDPIVYGTELSAAQLRAVASVPGTFKYGPELGAVLPAGEHKLSVVFTPADSVGYSPSQTAASLTVTKATPAITWPAPVAIARGAALSASQLNAIASVPGSFAYAPAAGEIPGSEVRELSIIFTPIDALNFTTARAVVALTITGKSPIAPLRPAPGEALFQSYSPKKVDVQRERKSTTKKWMAVAAVSTCSILLLLLLIVPLINRGTKFGAIPPVQPLPAVAADTQPAADTPKSPVPEPVTRDKSPATTRKQPATDNQTSKQDAEMTAEQVQSTMMNDQLTAPTRIPKQGAENAPPASSDTAGAEGLGGGNTDGDLFNGHAQHVVKAIFSRSIAVSSGVANGMLIQSPPPMYPPLAKTAHVAGTVELHATIATNGTIKDLRAVSGPAMLRQAAIDAVRSWRYKPYRLNNQPVEVETTINLVFTLGG